MVGDAKMEEDQSRWRLAQFVWFNYWLGFAVVTVVPFVCFFLASEIEFAFAFFAGHYPSGGAVSVSEYKFTR